MHTVSVGKQPIKGSEVEFEAFAIVNESEEEATQQQHESILENIGEMFGNDQVLEKATGYVKDTRGVCLIEGLCPPSCCYRVLN